MSTRSQFIEELIRKMGFSLERATESADRFKEFQPLSEEPKSKRVPDIPRLLAHGDDLNRLLEEHIFTQQILAYMDDPQPDDVVFDNESFLRRGVEGQCTEILEYIRKNRTRPISRGGCSEDGGQYAKQWCYVLLSYCADHAEPPPDRLMELAFKVFNCSELKFTRQSAAAGQRSIADDFDLGVSGVKDIDVFLKAAELDGRARAEGLELSLNQLANRVGASRASVKRWRETIFYKTRVDGSYWENS